MRYSDAECYLIGRAKELLGPIHTDEVEAIVHRLDSIAVREVFARKRDEAERQERLRECGVGVK